jgi:23S rRNA pseudouridine2457 synthase
MMNDDYFVIYKPFGMVSQFSGDDSTLKSLYEFPNDVYPVGRLDKDSEGLLILTNDKRLNQRLLDPMHGHFRTYYVQVEGVPTEKALVELQTGVRVNIDGRMYRTKKAQASLLQDLPKLPERYPPIRFRKSVPDTWIALSLTEGKNRQVRKMTAAVGHPTLRLVRWSIEDLSIQGFSSGEVRKYTKNEIYDLLKVSHGR